MTTILMVDDIPSHLKLGTMLLSDAGFEVRGASGAQAALRSARERRPDAILSDVVMDDMDGFGLCREVRGDAGLRGIPLVLTSAVFQDTEDAELAASIGANALVRTTTDFRDEISALHQSLAHGAPRSTPPLGLPFDLAHARRVSYQMTSLLERAVRSEGRCQLVLDSTRELEERLRQAKKMEAVGQLMGGLAHDFNNLLTVIMANASFLGEDLAAADPRADSVAQILGASKRAVGLTRQLLSFSRQDPRQLTVFAPATALEHFCKMLTRLIGEDIELRVELDPSTSPVHMDVGQLELVVLNLAVNARDAMPEGGRLTLELKDVALQANERSGTRELSAGSYVRLSVTDTGHGIPPDVRARIFEPFFTTKPADRGTGLGLATVREIVTEACGSICVESAPGRGTTFHIYLPRAGLEPKAEPRPADVVGPLAGHETVLLVEDDEAVAAVCRRMLEAGGYRVIVANSRATALTTIASAERIDLVIADVVMPSGNGPEAAVALRALRPDLKVLYMSGYTEHSALTAELLATPDNLLTKPFTSEMLLTRVRQALRPRS